jgi:hypothetical protein
MFVSPISQEVVTNRRPIKRTCEQSLTYKESYRMPEYVSSGMFKNKGTTVFVHHLMKIASR